MDKNISLPALTRLCTLYNLLDKLRTEGKENISSTELGGFLGVPAHTVRKDINCLGEVGRTGAGYTVSTLHHHIGGELCLNRQRNACVVGLGRIGSAILSYEGFTENGYTIVAGFDSNVNLLDTLRTSVPLYPTHEIPDVVVQKRIELAVIAVPAHVAQEIADRLVTAGVKGIVNFSPAVLKVDNGEVHVTDMNLINEFTILSALMGLDTGHDEREK